MSCVIVVTCLGTLLAFLAVRAFLRGSLPQLQGEVRLSGLRASVSVVRDELGAPTITGEGRMDVAYAMGFVHAQERFFQMDLLRRAGAGELSALLGTGALALDTERRRHRFRARAEAAFARLPARQQQLLSNYVLGVNSGLSALASRPFEYGLLRARPAPWTEVDSLLVIWTMYFDLQGLQESRKLVRAWLRARMTPSQWSFFLPEASDYDAPLDADHCSTPKVALPVSSPDWFGSALRAESVLPQMGWVGSNGCALAGHRTADGCALVLNDLHMGFTLPNLWFRARLVCRDQAGLSQNIVGVTLPGAPLVVAGSNSHVAWGFTNSFGDYVDVVELQRDPQNPRRFKTPSGWELADAFEEVLAVRGGKSEKLWVLECSLGPIRQVGDRFYAIHWIAHDRDAVDMGLFEMEQAQTLEQAQRVANRSGMPGLNMLAGDRAGQIGWTIAGTLPARNAFSAIRATWQGLRAADHYPRVINPPGGQLWSANSLHLASTSQNIVGDGGADLGARARQLRDALSNINDATEAHAYAILHDDRAQFMAEWRDRALRALDEVSVRGNPRRLEFRRLLREGWSGHADVESVGYRLARAYLDSIYLEMFGELDSLLNGHAPGLTFALANPRWPVVAACLLDAAPDGWLTNGNSWRKLELAAVDRAIEQVIRNHCSLSAATWGRYNAAHIAHPFARSLPGLKRWLSAPGDPLAGDEHMPRVAVQGVGSAACFVVSPGHEERGIFNMPGGQSGHPLSPYFLAGHAAWVAGRPLPLLPGKPRYRLVLKPE